MIKDLNRAGFPETGTHVGSRRWWDSGGVQPKLLTMVSECYSLTLELANLQALSPLSLPSVALGFVMRRLAFSRLGLDFARHLCNRDREGRA